MRPISISGSHFYRLPEDTMGTWTMATNIGMAECFVSVHELKHAVTPCRQGCNPLTCDAETHLVRTNVILRTGFRLEDVPCNLMEAA